jgi:hypothetical protein
MWSLLVGVIGAAVFIIVVARTRRRAAMRKRIEVGSVSEGWIAQHRGGRHE